MLILGKGHEKTILRAEGPVEFEDTKVARKALREKVRAIEIRKEALEKARKAKELEALKKKKAELAKKKKAREKYGNTHW